MKTTRRWIAMILVFSLLLSFSGISASADSQLAMPKALRVIESEAFYGSTSIDRVVLPEGISEIRAKAFANSSLSEINLPGSLTFIAENAFDGLHNVSTTAKEGTYGYNWAVSHGFMTRNPEEEILLDKNKLILFEGETEFLNVEFPSGACEEVTWSSNNSTVASVDNGTVTAVSEGICAITATGGGKSVSCTVIVEERASIPDTPEGLTAETDDEDNVIVRWNQSNGAYGYRIYYTGTDETERRISALDTEHTTAEIPSVCFGTGNRLSVQITAFNQAGESERSASVTVRRVVRTITTELSGNVQGDSILLTWAAVDGAYGYAVYRSELQNSGYQILATLPADILTYRDTSGTIGATLYYKVRPIMSDGALSNAVQGMAEAIIPVFNTEKVVMKAGDIVSLPYTVPQSYRGTSATWASDNPDVATVDENGQVTAVAVGNTVITLTTNDGIASCEIVVAGQIRINNKAARTWNTDDDYEISKTYTITSDDSWNAVSSQSWIILDIDSGSDGETQVTVTAQQNTSTLSRTGNVTFQTGGSTAVLTVVQPGVLADYPSIKTPVLSSDPVNPTIVGNTDTLTFTWDREPQVTSYAVKIKEKTSSGGWTTKYSSGDKTSGSYTFTSLAFDEGEVYKVEFSRKGSRKDDHKTVYYIATDVDPAELTVTGGENNEGVLFHAYGEGSHESFRVDCNVAWDATSNNPDWIMVDNNEWYDEEKLEREGLLPEYMSYIYGGNGHTLFISTMPNPTNKVRTGSVLIESFGVQHVIQVEQEAYYELPEITSHTFGKSRKKSVEIPYGDLQLAWNAGVGNNGKYWLTLDKFEGGTYQEAYSRSSSSSRKCTIEEGYLEQNQQYRLRLYTTLSSTNETAYRSYYFTVGSETALSVSATADWGATTEGYISVTAKAAGGAGGYQYAYTLKYGNSTIRTVEYGPWLTMGFRPEERETGLYSVVVYCKDAAGNTAECVVSGNMEPPKVSSIMIIGNDFSVMVGETLQLTAQIEPADAAGQSVTWYIDNPWCAEIDPSSGALTGVSAGAVTVTAESQDGTGRMASVSVIVYEAGSEPEPEEQEPQQEIPFTFSVDRTEVNVGEPVSFTITHGEDTEKLNLIVDGISYDVFDAKGIKTVFTRVFNQSGQRNVQFKRMVHGEWYDWSDNYETISVSRTEVLSKPQVTVESSFTANPAYMHISVVDHANTYTVTVSDPRGSVILSSPISSEKLAENNQTVMIASEKLYLNGQYDYSVIVSGKNYDQAETQGSFTLESSDFNAEIISPQTGDNYISGSPMQVHVRQNGGGYMNVRLTDKYGETVAEYPAGENALTAAEEINEQYTPAEQGEITVWVTVYPVNAPYEMNSPEVIKSVTVNVLGPSVESVRPGRADQSWTWVQDSDPKKIFVRSNNATDRATVILNGASLGTDTEPDTAMDNQWIRVFEFDVPSSQPGRQTVWVTAGDDDIRTDTGTAQATGTFEYYYAKKVSPEYPVYPVNEIMTVKSSPIDGRDICSLIVSEDVIQSVTVTHDAGDWIRIRTVDGQVGFVRKDETTEELPSNADGKLHIISPKSGTVCSQTTAKMRVEWSAGFVLPAQPEVTASIQEIGKAVKVSEKQTGRKPVDLDISSLQNGSYMLYLSVKDINGTAHGANTVFCVDMTTEEDKQETDWRAWFQDKGPLSIWTLYAEEYIGNYGRSESVGRLMSSQEYLFSVIRNGYLCDRDKHFLPWKTNKVGLDHATMAEQELETERVAVISGQIQNRELKRISSANAVESMIESKSTSAVVRQKAKTIIDGIKMAADACTTALDIAGIVTKTGASEMNGFVKKLPGIISETAGTVGDIFLTIYDEYDEQIMLAKYIDVYRDALLYASSEYVDYLETSYFGSKGASGTIPESAMTFTQATAYAIIQKFHEYDRRLKAIPEFTSADDAAVMENEIIREIVRDLMVESGYAASELEQYLCDVEQDSLDLQRIMENALPDILNKVFDMLIDKLVDELIGRMTDEDKDLLKRREGCEWAHNISGSALVSIISNFLQNAIDCRVANNNGEFELAIDFDWEGAFQKLGNDIGTYGITSAGLFVVIGEILKKDYLPLMDNLELGDKVKIVKSVLKGTDQGDMDNHLQKKENSPKAGTIFKAFKNAWKTGSSVARFWNDVEMLGNYTNGLDELRSYTTLFYVGMREWHELILKNRSILDKYKLGEGLTTEEMEQGRQVIATLIRLTLEINRYYESMRTVHAKLDGWSFSTYGDNNIVFKYNNYSLLNAVSKDWLEKGMVLLGK